MNRIPLSSHDPELEQLADRFAHWRQCRTTPKERIPIPLWDQAAILCQTRPPSRVAKHLGLCTSDLKKRCQAHQPCTPLSVAVESPIDFVEVSPPSWPQSGSVQINMQRLDGTRLHLVFQDTSVPLIELVRTFLEAK